MWYLYSAHTPRCLTIYSSCLPPEIPAPALYRTAGVRGYINTFPLTLFLPFAFEMSIHYGLACAAYSTYRLHVYYRTDTI